MTAAGIESMTKSKYDRKKDNQLYIAGYSGKDLSMVDHLLNLFDRYSETDWDEYAYRDGDSFLELFGEEDWNDLIKSLPLLTNSRLLKLMCCIRNGSDSHHIRILQELIENGKDDTIVSVLKCAVNMSNCPQFRLPAAAAVRFAQRMLRFLPDADERYVSLIYYALDRIPELPPELKRKFPPKHTKQHTQLLTPGVNEAVIDISEYGLDHPPVIIRMDVDPFARYTREAQRKTTEIALTIYSDSNTYAGITVTFI